MKEEENTYRGDALHKNASEDLCVEISLLSLHQILFTSDSARDKTKTKSEVKTQAEEPEPTQEQ